MNSIIRSIKPFAVAASRRPTLFVLTGASLATASALGYATVSHCDDGQRPKTFTSVGFRTLALEETEQVTKNVKKLRFSLPSEDHVAGLTVSSFVIALIRKKDTWVPQFLIRPYTPVSHEEDAGYMDLMVKLNEEKATDPANSASHALHNLKPGDTVRFFGKMISAKLPEYKANEMKQVGMVAGGSGITPMLQILRKALSDPDDATQFHLLYCNRTEDDIILKESLDKLASAHPERFKVTYSLSRAAPEAWQGETGRVNAEMLKKVLPQGNEQQVRLYVCGPPGMVTALLGNKTTQGLLEPLYEKKQIVEF
ncbi:hypothetical protein BC940DRAFT_309182 [Gongronella butleri]|nr:hypothetical protein BC940DRAFT_309182 [Gongronella butleri]